jgi:hypothetical protein
MLEVPVELVRHVAPLLAAERRRRGTREGSRILTTYRPAVFALTWFRKREDIEDLGTQPAQTAPAWYPLVVSMATPTPIGRR